METLKHAAIAAIMASLAACSSSPSPTTVIPASPQLSVPPNPTFAFPKATDYSCQGRVTAFQMLQEFYADQTPERAAAIATAGTPADLQRLIMPSVSDVAAFHGRELTILVELDKAAGVGAGAEAGCRYHSDYFSGKPVD